MNELDQAYAQGFSDKCAEQGVEPEVLLKTSASEPRRGGALASHLLNIITPLGLGSAFYPAYKAAPGRGLEGFARGAGYGLGGGLVGGAAGGVAGGGVGAGAGLLASLLSKGRLAPSVGARGGAMVGGGTGISLGGLAGSTEGIYRAAKRVAPSNEKAKMKIKELIRSMRG